MSERKLRWFSGSGGPLLLLPRELLESWEGIDRPSGGRVVRAEGRWDPAAPATDYDRACDVDDPIANVDVGPGRGIVLGGEPHFTAVWPHGAGIVLVRWLEAESEDQIIGHLERLSVEPEGDWVALIEAHPGPLVLFDSACPGVEVEDDKLEIDVHPGQYMASAMGYEPGDGTSLLLIQLTRVG